MGEKDKIISDFQFIDSYVRSSDMKIHSRNIENSKLDLEIEVKISEIKEDEKELSAELRLRNIVKIYNKEHEELLVEINVEMAGVFKSNNIEKDKFIQFMQFSGTPIISQTIRSYIMSLSALGGIDTIRIPLVNYVEFFKENETKQDDNDK